MSEIKRFIADNCDDCALYQDGLCGRIESCLMRQDALREAIQEAEELGL
jgi:7-cyano-7-deazaguanine synthase in queuosine biosynthesis